MNTVDSPGSADRDGDSRPHGSEPADTGARGDVGADVVPLGVDDTAHVRMPHAYDCEEFGLAADEPMVEVFRWKGITEIFQDPDASFMFVLPEQDPGNEARLAKIREIVEDLSKIVRQGKKIPTEERMVVRYEVSRRTLRRALAEVHELGGSGDELGLPMR